MTDSFAALAKAASELAAHVKAIADYVGLEHIASLSLCNSLQAILRTIETIQPSEADLAGAVATQHLQRILEASKAGIAWMNLKSTNAEVYLDAAWSTPASPMRAALSTGLSFFGRLKGSYRQASKILATLIKVPLPRSPQQRIALVDTLIAVEMAYARLKAEDVELVSMLPSHWQGPNTNF